MGAPSREGRDEEMGKQPDATVEQNHDGRSACHPGRRCRISICIISSLVLLLLGAAYNAALTGEGDEDPVLLMERSPLRPLALELVSEEACNKYVRSQRIFGFAAVLNCTQQAIMETRNGPR